MSASAPRSSSPARLGDVVRGVVNDLPGQGWLDRQGLKVLRRLAACGTGLLGWKMQTCTDCGVVDWRGHGCQDRHCPGCGHIKTREWTAAREAELLAAPYFHYVFTVPGQLYPLFLTNQSLLYGLFFRCVKETLAAFAVDPKFLGGTPAVFAILHTTNRKLGYHPHIHVVLSGAGLDEKADKLVLPPKADFLYPARPLASGLRGRLLTGLRKLHTEGKLDLDSPSMHQLVDKRVFNALIDKLFRVKWQVHTRAAFGGPQQVVRYLARYTHRTAISNNRIVAHRGGQVTYRWTDRRSGGRRYRKLPTITFLKQFARHILPCGFKRIRFWGLLAPTKRKERLPRAQRLALAHERLAALGQTISCSLQPELLPQITCRSCGSEHIVILGNEFRRSAPWRFPATLPIPPP